ncbi:resistance to Congo red protein [Georgenia subflava]|uniref:Uncharacterized protein n=1 Tax=Georgenia subflava TaxID=1622177 RepID=A0A6N7EHJ5_9MICO|nr:resistance to Congo red protein [Georgenia subflava]MPV36458.1 hypothetical protein [Georgenia subflava]
MDTGTWILAAVIIILLALWVISTAKGSRRRQHAGDSKDRPEGHMQEDHRIFGHNDLSGTDGF